jgi:hypothetical protein
VIFAVPALTAKPLPSELLIPVAPLTIIMLAVPSVKLYVPVPNGLELDLSNTRYT